jgi:hypothetical protein
MTALVLALEREYAFVTYRIRPMSADDIPVMTSWHYPPPYDFYDPDANENDLAELSDPSRWGHEHFTAVNEPHEVVGFFQFRRPEPGLFIEIGLGLRPHLTGIHGLNCGEKGSSVRRNGHRPRSCQLVEHRSRLSKGRRARNRWPRPASANVP